MRVFELLQRSKTIVRQDHRAGGVSDECRRASFVELFHESKNGAQVPRKNAGMHARNGTK